MSIEKVKAYFRTLGIEDRIMEFENSTATVAEAAAVNHCEEGQICKTLSFQDPEDPDGCLLIQMAGNGKINNQKFKKTFHFKAKMLSAEDAVRITGHAVGGVCAFGIDNPKVKVYCDESLRRYDTVLPAAGNDKSAIRFTCDELFRYSRALEWIDVAKLPEADAE